jgi:hypothetical protein
MKQGLGDSVQAPEQAPALGFGDLEEESRFRLLLGWALFPDAVCRLVTEMST